MRINASADGFVLSRDDRSSTIYITYTPAAPIQKPRPSATVKSQITAEGVILTVPYWVVAGDPVEVAA